MTRLGESRRWKWERKKSWLDAQTLRKKFDGREPYLLRFHLLPVFFGLRTSIRQKCALHFVKRVDLDSSLPFLPTDSMRASSQNDPSITSYTDVILIQSNGTTGDVPFATSGVAATSTFPLDGAAPSSGGSVSGSSSSAPTSTIGASSQSSTESSASSSSTAQATGTPDEGDGSGNLKIGNSLVFGVGSVALGLGLLL